MLANKWDKASQLLQFSHDLHLWVCWHQISQKSTPETFFFTFCLVCASHCRALHLSLERKSLALMYRSFAVVRYCPLIDWFKISALCSFMTLTEYFGNYGRPSLASWPVKHTALSQLLLWYSSSPPLVWHMFKVAAVFDLLQKPEVFWLALWSCCTFHWGSFSRMPSSVCDHKNPQRFCLLRGTVVAENISDKSASPVVLDLLQLRNRHLSLGCTKPFVTKQLCNCDFLCFHTLY